MPFQVYSTAIIKQYIREVLSMISVVLAAYKGEKYIGAQVESIINQLGEDDELIISDDFPAGKTKESISELMSRDKRIV